MRIHIYLFLFQMLINVSFVADAMVSLEASNTIAKKLKLKLWQGVVLNLQILLKVAYIILLKDPTKPNRVSLGIYKIVYLFKILFRFSRLSCPFGTLAKPVFLSKVL